MLEFLKNVGRSNQVLDRFISLVAGKIKNHPPPLKKPCSSVQLTVRLSQVWSGLIQSYTQTCHTAKVEGTPVQPPPVGAGRQGRDYSEAWGGQIKRRRENRSGVPICWAAGIPRFLEWDGKWLMSQTDTHKPPARVRCKQTCACSDKCPTATRWCVIYFELWNCYLQKQEKQPPVRTDSNAEPSFAALMCCHLKAQQKEKRL